MPKRPTRKGPAPKEEFVEATRAAGDAQPEAEHKTVTDPAFNTNSMTRKMVAETAKRIAKSMDALERTKPKNKGRSDNEGS